MNIQLIPFNKEEQKVKRTFKLGQSYLKTFAHGAGVSYGIKFQSFSSAKQKKKIKLLKKQENWSNEGNKMKLKYGEPEIKKAVPPGDSLFFLME